MLYWIAGITIVLFVCALFAPKFLMWQRKQELRRAVQEFRVRRETLEAKFYDLAINLGKPRGLTWKTCEWKEPVTFARDRTTGLLTAFASVEISFEAIEGGGMEDVDAVGDIRDASAVFHYHDGRWGTGGKALFNMNPHLAAEKLQEQYQPVEV